MDNYKTQALHYSNKLLLMVQQHAAVLFIIVFASLTGYLVIRSGELINREPTDTQVLEKKSEIKRVKIDENSLRVVEELNSRNINLESLFIDRNNPFEN